MPTLARRNAAHMRRSRKRNAMMDAMAAVAEVSTSRADMTTKKIPCFIMIVFCVLCVPLRVPMCTLAIPKYQGMG